MLFSYDREMVMGTQILDVGGLSGPYQAPAYGEAPQQIIILLHGWGADGADLIDLAHPLSVRLPLAGIYAPNAPHPCGAGTSGFEWFDLMDRQAMQVEAAAARPIIHKLLDGVAATFSLPTDRILLAGFSQGGMMSILGGLSYGQKLAGLVSIAGAVLAPDDIPEAPEPPQAATDIFMIHGDADPVVPFQALDLGLQLLQNKGYRTERLACEGVGHGISPDALSAMIGFADTQFG